MRWDCLRVEALVYDQHMANAAVPVSDITFTPEEIVHIVSKRTTIETLADELRRRGCTVFYPDEVPPTSLQVVEASMDFNKWMRLVRGLEAYAPNKARYDGSLVDEALARAMLLLVDLLQPPSVREARARSAASE